MGLVEHGAALHQSVRRFVGAACPNGGYVVSSPDWLARNLYVRDEAGVRAVGVEKGDAAMLPAQLEHRSSWGNVVEWGAIAGLVGGLAMAMLMMIVSLVDGSGFWTPLYLIAATFHRSWAQASGFALAPMLAGMLLHLFNSALFGVIFAVCVRFVMPRPVSLRVAVILGVVWGLILLIVMTFGIAASVDPALPRALLADGGVFAWWLIAHLLYGGVLGAVFAESNAAQLPAPETRFGPQTGS
jgi:hypothetical protein